MRNRNNWPGFRTRMFVPRNLTPQPGSFMPHAVRNFSPRPRFVVPQEGMATRPRNYDQHSNEERYDRFVTTFLHGSDWTAGTRYFAIYWLTFRDKQRQLFSPLFENGDGTCAESHLMDHLRLQISVISRDKLVEICVFQNSSPCARCSSRYETELSGLITHSGVRVTVVFSSMYRIKRLSCESRCHGHSIYDYQHTQNKAGLLKLRQCGIQLSTPTFQDWKKLRNALQLPKNLLERYYIISSRKEEDDLLKEDLQIILNT